MTLAEFATNHPGMYMAISVTVAGGMMFGMHQLMSWIGRRLKGPR